MFCVCAGVCVRLCVCVRVCVCVYTASAGLRRTPMPYWYAIPSCNRAVSCELAAARYVSTA
jgi:hypothetical protein